MKRFVTMMMMSLFAAGTSMAQGLNLTASGLNITGAGARAEGLGGAFIGVADDATAIVWNPAGLTQLERAEASVVTRIVFEKADFSVPEAPEFNSSLSQSHVAFNFGSFALPFKLGNTAVVIAAAYQRQIDLYSNLKTEGTNVFGVQETDEEEGKGGVDTFTPAISFKPVPVLSIGAAANIWTGTYDLTQKANTLSVSHVISQSLPYKGFNMVFGGLLDLEALPRPVPLKFGITFRTPFELKADGSIKENVNGDITEAKITETVQMPMMLGFGASARLGENFTIAADYEIRAYKDKEITDDIEGIGKTSEKLSASNENVNEFRVGAEYLIVSTNFVIPLRAGYRTVPTLLANMNDAGELDQVSGKAISVGSGYISNAIAIDIAYTATDYTQTFGSFASLKYTTGMISASAIVYF